MKIGEIIKNRRIQLGLTLEEVGNAVGVGKSTVRKWETGVISNMGRDKIAALSKILNIDPVFFVCEEPVLSEPLSADEKEIIDCFRSTNATGKEMILAQVRMISNTNEYKKSDTVQKIG